MAAWSFTKLNNFETCPRRYHAYNVAKTVKDDESDDLKWGNYVHKALENTLLGREPLPDQLAPYQKWIDRVWSGPGNLYVEQKYALDKNFRPCAYFAPVVWYRGKADVARVHENVALAIDWKTGKPKEGSVQLALMAACIFATFPEVQKVRSEYVWLQDDSHTGEIFDRAGMAGFWGMMLPRVAAIDEAYQTNTFNPKPSGLCKKYCGVTGCEFHGKGAYG